MKRFAKLSLPKFSLILLILVTGFALLGGTAPQVATGTWQNGPDMNEARTGAAAVTLDDGRVLVFGGNNGSGSTNAVQVFSDGSWSDLGAVMLDARSGHTATMLKDGRILIAGGENSSGALSSLEIYDPSSGAFSSAGTLSGARTSHGAARLPSGNVLIIGGSDGSSALASSEIYDAASGSVSAGPSLSAPRSGLTATRLLDGKVLIAGGNNGEADLASTLIYNPADGSFSAGADLSAPRSGHSAALLPHNNAVLISGGSGSASAELYIPWTNSVSSTASMNAARDGAAASGSGWDGVALVVGGGSASSELYGFATVNTDADDYAPGTTVYITGSGWQPGETVYLLLQEFPEIHDDRVLTAVADASGNISNNEFAPELHHIGVRFYLSAVGANSQAQITFTDGELVTAEVAGTSNDVTVAQGSSSSFDIKLSATGPIKCTATSLTPATATVRTVYSINSAGVVSSSTPSAAQNFFAGAPTSGPNCDTIWTGSPTPYSVTASVSAAATTPVGDYTITLSAAAGTTTVFTPAGMGASLADATPTAITVHVVAPSDTTAPDAPVVNIIPTYVNIANQNAVDITISGEVGATVAGSVTSAGGAGSVALSGTIPADGSLELTKDLSGLPDGTLTASATLTDAGSNTSDPGTDTATKDTLAPTVTIDQAGGQADPTNTSPINFTAVFSESVSDFATGDVTLGGTAGATTQLVSGGPTSYNVAVSSMAIDGTVTASIAAGVAHDAAGNPSSASTSGDNEVTYDTTAPLVTVDFGTPDGSNNWFIHDPVTGGVDASDASKVTAISCTDDASGLTEGVLVGENTPSASRTLSVSGEGVHNVSCTATDGAGNTGAAPGSTDTATVKIDTVAPTLTLVFTPNSPDGSNGWWKTPGGVPFTWTCTDATSGIDATYNDGCPSPLTGMITANGTTNFSDQVRDLAGHLSVAVNRDLMLDNVAPSITITTPPEGASYLLNQMVAADFACSDASPGSGLASCVGTVADGANIDTDDVAPHSFTVNASDNAGNTNSATTNYGVSFNVCALYDQTKSHKKGSTVPVKLQLCDVNGVNYSSASIVVTATTLVRTDTSASGILDDSGQANSPEFNFRFDPTLGGTGGYIFNLSTKPLATGTWKLSFTVNGVVATNYFVQFDVK